MERNLWAKFVEFFKTSITQRFKAFFSGSCAGLYLSKHIFFAGIPGEFGNYVVIFGTYLLKYTGAIILTGSTALVTCWVNYRFEKYTKNKENVTPQKRRKGNENDRAA